MLLLVYTSVCVLYLPNIVGFYFERLLEPTDITSKATFKRSYRGPENEQEEPNSEAPKLENKATEQKDKHENFLASSAIEFGGKLRRSLAMINHEKRALESSGPFTIEPISELVEGVMELNRWSKDKISAYEDSFTDPEWLNQWYMHDYRTVLGPVMDLNVVPVYRMGYTGAGIYVAVVDTGVEMNHPDLQKNLEKDMSYTADGNIKGSAEPTRNIFLWKKDPHGTQSAGIIGMTANNSYCGVGIAYNAKLVAINAFVMMDFGRIKGRVLAHASHRVDIYSNSWGPLDSGTHMDHIKKPVAMAIDHGINHGRKGLGSIYTFAAGNGKKNGDDNCSADEVINYIHTIGIAGAKQNGKRAEFSETCSAIYATTYSGGYSGLLVTSTTNQGGCKKRCSGTSAATPQASAIIALVLQANKKLTYRDVMHLITMGSEVAPLADNHSWNKNGAGFWVSNEFGFGLMNAYNMVKLAKQWTNVPKKTVCEVKFTIEINNPARVSQKTDGCQYSRNQEERVFYLEQVILTSCIKHRYRGAISITLTSPRGTETEVLTPRKKDTHTKGLSKWDLKSVHHWGENPSGEWKIEVKANFLKEGLGKAWENMYQSLQPFVFRTPDYYETGKLQAFTLWFHGTREKPDHHIKGLVPRTYSAFRTADGKTNVQLTHLHKTEGGISSEQLHESQIT